MTLEELNQLLNDSLANAGDTALLSSNLSTVKDNITAIFASASTANAEVERLKTENENLRATNMQLFLKVGSTAPTEKKEDTKNNDDELKIDDLLNEKGGLK